MVDREIQNHWPYYSGSNYYVYIDIWINWNNSLYNMKEG